jgi:hypothetical protein
MVKVLLETTILILKSFRPMSLSSFLLKTMERLVDLHLKDYPKRQIDRDRTTFYGFTVNFTILFCGFQQ